MNDKTFIWLTALHGARLLLAPCEELLAAFQHEREGRRDTQEETQKSHGEKGSKKPRREWPYILSYSVGELSTFGRHTNFGSQAPDQSTMMLLCCKQM